MTPLRFLQSRLPAAPPAYLRQLLRHGRIERDGRPLDEGAVLRPGERLRGPDSRRLLELRETAAALRIIHEEPHLLAVCKPAGLAVHRGESHEQDNLTDRLRAALGARGTDLLLAPVNRLDRDTSGLVLFGKGRRSLAALGRIFMDRQAEKRYLALVRGRVAEAGRLTAAVPAKGKIKPAETEFSPLGADGRFSLLELRIVTGRTHQIRRHLAQIGHPLVGDRRFGGPSWPGLDRHFLHCWRLDLPNPFGDARLRLHCPPPPELLAVLAELGLDGSLPATMTAPPAALTGS